MKILASILLIFITSMCFGQDYYAIMKQHRLDKIYDMLTFDFQVRKFQWLKTLDIKNFKAQEGFKKQNLVIEKNTSQELFFLRLPSLKSKEMKILGKRN